MQEKEKVKSESVWWLYHNWIVGCVRILVSHLANGLDAKCTLHRRTEFGSQGRMEVCPGHRGMVTWPGLTREGRGKPAAESQALGGDECQANNESINEPVNPSIHPSIHQ